MQDSRGFIWFGHRDGIERFDGTEFRCFFYDPPEASYEYLNNFVEGPDGYFWLMVSDKFIKIFDPVTEEFYDPEEIYSQALFEEEKPQSLNKINGGLWFKTWSNKYYFFDGKSFKEIDLGIAANENGDLRPIAGGLYAFTSGQNISILNPQGSILKEYTIPYSTSSVLTDEKNRIWAIPAASQLTTLLTYIEDGALHNLEIGGLADQYKGAYFGQPVDIFYDKQDNIIVHLYGLIQIFDSNFNKLANLTETVARSGGSKNFIDPLLDSFGNLWLATYNGVYLLTNKQTHFNTLMVGPFNNENSIRGITQGVGGKMYIQSYQGSKIYDPNSGKLETWDRPNPKNGLCLQKDKNGIIWASVHDRFILRFDQLSGAVEKYPLEDDGVAEAYTVHRDRNNTLWVGSSVGVGIIDTIKKVVKSCEKPALANISVICIHENADGLWFGTGENGLIHLNLQNGAVNQVIAFDKFRVNHIYEDQQGVFWISTNGAGLVAWDKASGLAKYYTKKDGLSSNFIYAAYEDILGRLWLPSNNGLMMFFKDSGRVNLFLPKDGIAHEEFNLLAHYRSEDGTIWLGGLNGITYFNPNKIIKNDLEQYPLLLTNFKLLRNDIWVNLPNQTRSVEIRPNETALALEFVHLNYNNPQSSRYAYKIEETDYDWTYLNNNSFVIRNLPSKELTLKIKAEAMGFSSSNSELELSLKVVKPFHETWIFYLLIVLAVFGLTFLTVVWRTARLNKRKIELEREVTKRSAELRIKNEELNELNRSKDTLFAVVAHDIKSALLTFRGVTTKVSYLLKENQPERIVQMGADIDNASKQLETNLDNLLNWAVSQRGALPYEPAFINIAKAVDSNFGIFKRIAERKQVRLVNEVDKEAVAFVDPNALGVILRNIISNSIKYSPIGKQVTVSQVQFSDRTEINIKDEGEGVSQERLEALFDIVESKSTRGTMGEKGTGLGLVISQTLAKQNKGEIKVKSSLMEGSCFTVVLPINKV